MTTTNVTLTGSYVKSIDAADTAWKVTAGGYSDIEFVYSTGAPSEALKGHILSRKDGISIDNWGAGDIYFRKSEVTATAVIVITKD